MAAIIPSTDGEDAGDPVDVPDAMPEALGAAPEPQEAIPDASAAEARAVPEEETDEQWMHRFLEENAHLARPRPERPPAPPPSPWDGPPSSWKVPDHLSMRHPRGGYMAMALLSRTMDDLDEVTRGERAATYEEVDKYFGHALIAEGLVPFTYTADQAIWWWKSGGYKVLGGDSVDAQPMPSDTTSAHSPGQTLDPNPRDDDAASAPHLSNAALMVGPDGRAAPQPSPALFLRDKQNVFDAAAPVEDGGVVSPDFGGAPLKGGQTYGGTLSGANNDAGNGPQLVNASFGGEAGSQMPWSGLGEGWRLPLSSVSPEQVIKNAGNMAADEIRHQLVTLRKAGAGAAARAAAYVAVTAAINTPFTTPLAARLLTEWRDGASKTTRGNPEVFDWDSEASHELMFGYTGDYYRNISKLGIAQLIAAGKLTEGQVIKVDGIPSYDTDYGSAGLSDGINVGDAIGTFTYGVFAEVKGQYVYFTGKNAMSLGSFSGDNILRHGQVDNPTRGAFSTTYQNFVWRVPVPVVLKRGK